MIVCNLHQLCRSTPALLHLGERTGERVHGRIWQRLGEAQVIDDRHHDPPIVSLPRRRIGDTGRANTGR